MIKFRYAKFVNFRGLRDVTVRFSTSDAKPLTVIRAANYTGKTTLLYGLTWGLFGDSGLPEPPRRRDHYRLHPVDWNTREDGDVVQIEVEVGFTVFDVRSGLSDDYVLIRTGSEVIEGKTWRPRETRFSLVKQSPQGDTPIANPDRIIDLELLPLSKKDIYFVDGDKRVQDYVKDAESESRANVREAVRHLLALDVVESAQGHVRDVLRDKVKAIQKNNAGTELADAAASVQEIEQRIEDRKAKVSDLELDLKAATAQVETYSRLRDTALLAGGGDAKRLKQELTSATKTRNESLARQGDATKNMRTFVNAPELLVLLAEPSIAKANAVYEELRRERKIPNVLPSLLRARLQEGVCICGADLTAGTAEHQHISEELKSVERLDSNRTSLGALSDNARSVMDSSLWAEGAVSAFKAWLEAGRAAARADSDIQDLEHRVAKTAGAHEELGIADDNLRRARDSRVGLDRDLVRARIEVGDLESQERRARENLARLTKQDGRLKQSGAEEQAGQDISSVLDHAVDTLLGSTIDEVSNRMNSLFMTMIASAPEAEGGGDAGVVQRVALSRECDIRVFGPEDRDLKPRTDISGAQQQALTVALIMALVEVSGDTSPMVIDTPLGMTSGVVRTNFLSETLGLDRLAAQKDGAVEMTPQKILLMTPKEIEGVESLLEKAVGEACTLTNSQHFPEQLVNDPGLDYNEVLVCSCGPQPSSYCDVCQRKDGS